MKLEDKLKNLLPIGAIVVDDSSQWCSKRFYVVQGTPKFLIPRWSIDVHYVCVRARCIKMWNQDGIRSETDYNEGYILGKQHSLKGPFSRTKALNEIKKMGVFKSKEELLLAYPEDEFVIEFLTRCV